MTILIGRRNFIAQSGVIFTPDGIDWNLNLNRLTNINPQVVAQVSSNLQADTSFVVDLGAPRLVRAISFANFRASSSATMEITAALSDIESPIWTSGVISVWPKDRAPFTMNPWGVLTLNGTYNFDLYESIGMQRIIIADPVINIQYIRVAVSDTSLASPLQIGVMGAWECWEPPHDFAPGWTITMEDLSELHEVKFGSTYVTNRPIQRVMNFGFDKIDKTEVFQRQLDLMLYSRYSRPTIIIPFPESDGDYLEKSTIYGLFQSSQISNPLVDLYDSTYRVKQMV